MRTIPTFTPPDERQMTAAEAALPQAAASPDPRDARDVARQTTIPLSSGPGAPAPGAWSYAGGAVPPLPPVEAVGTDRPARRRRLVMLACGLLVVLVLGTVLGVLHARGSAATTPAVTISATSSGDSGSVQALQQSVESVLQAVEPSVVEVTSTGGSGEAIGSGDILTSNGYIVTNDHVVQGYSSFRVTLASGKSYAAALVGQDAAEDLAVLKIAATNLKAIALGDSARAQVGDFVVAVGNPLGLQESATFGIVSALNRTASEAPSGPAGELTGLIQTSAPLNPGNSGGALVNLAGQLIGIPTLGATNAETGTTADGIGYAIPSDQVATVATHLIQSGSSGN